MKIWSAVLSLSVGALLLALAGCGAFTLKTTPPPASPATPDDGALDRVKKAGVLRWGADNSGGAPFVYIDDKDKTTVIGFEVDIMDKLAEHMGVKHKQIQVAWDALTEDMNAGRSDMVMNGIEITESRKKNVDFSQPYFVYEQQLTVRAEDKEKYTSLESLKGKKVATLKGAEANNVLKAAGFEETLISPLDDSSQPYEELKNKRVEAVLQENIIAAFYAGPRAELYNVPKTFSPGKYAVAFKKGDDSLRNEVDRVITLMKENGELAAIYAKWKILTETQKTVGVKEKK